MNQHTREDQTYTIKGRMRPPYRDTCCSGYIHRTGIEIGSKKKEEGRETRGSEVCKEEKREVVSYGRKMGRTEGKEKLVLRVCEKEGGGGAG